MARTVSWWIVWEASVDSPRRSLGSRTAHRARCFAAACRGGGGAARDTDCLGGLEPGPERAGGQVLCAPGEEAGLTGENKVLCALGEVVRRGSTLCPRRRGGGWSERGGQVLFAPGEVMAGLRGKIQTPWGAEARAGGRSSPHLGQHVPSASTHACSAGQADSPPSPRRPPVDGRWWPQPSCPSPMPRPRRRWCPVRGSSTPSTLATSTTRSARCSPPSSPTGARCWATASSASARASRCGGLLKKKERAGWGCWH